MGRRRLAIGTANPGKLRELEVLLADPGLELVPCPIEVAEDAATYVGNARSKAEAALGASGLPSLGDDSGLEVEALDGYPGVRSRRIAPTQPEREAIIFGRLRDEPAPWRARFVCALVLARPGLPPEQFVGTVEGELVQPRRGDAGFGYDPVFQIPQAGRTFGEMGEAEKRRWSHRARAAAALRRSGLLP